MSESDERICGKRSPEGITCLLLPDHPSKTCAGFDENYSMVTWPRDKDYQPQHYAKSEGKSYDQAV